jgi:hypothetical protein
MKEGIKSRRQEINKQRRKKKKEEIKYKEKNKIVTEERPREGKEKRIGKE